MRIAILSVYSGIFQRGAENWASDLRSHYGNEIIIISGNYLKKIRDWITADIVIPTNGRFQVLFVRIVTFLVRKPMIVFGHSGPGADDKWNLLCSPTYFVSFTHAQKDWADRYKLPWTKSIVIYHGVDISRFKSGKIKNRSVVLCVAANIPQKRIDLVRKAVHLLKDVTFSAVGKGNDRQVKFEEMPAIYKEASVLCFVPEPSEAFGLVYLEALASNVPVVTIDDPIRREIVGESGLFVKHPENIKRLSQIIQKALDINWGNKPRLQAEKFSWTGIITDYKNLFNSFRK